MLIRTYADIEKLQGEDALSEAERLLIENCRIGEPTVLGDGLLPVKSSSDRAIRAELLRYLVLGGCADCGVHELGVRVVGAWVRGQLNLRYLTVKGAINFTNCNFTDQINAQQAHVQSVQMKGSKTPGLDFERVQVAGNVVIDRLESGTMVSFAGARIGSQLSCMDAVLHGETDCALNAQKALIGDSVFLDRSKVYGQVLLAGAEIGGQLNCRETVLNGLGGFALNAQQASIRAGVFLSGIVSTGEINFSSAKIGGQLNCQGANLKDNLKLAFSIQSASVGGSVDFSHINSSGEVSLSGAQIGGSISFGGAVMRSVGGNTLNAQNAEVEGGLYIRRVKSIKGRAEFASSRFRQLVDDASSWNEIENLCLVGCTYQEIYGPLDLEFRTKWLLRGAKFNGQFHPQPYQQLAKFYRETGHRREAREILIEKEKEQRKAGKTGILVRLWDAAAASVAGYGYKPWLSLWWLAGLVAVMMGMAQLTWNAGDFAPNSAVVLTSQDWKTIADGPSENPAADWSDALAPGKDYETFYSFAYALDVVVPVLDLGQTDAWAPSPARGDAGKRLFYLQKIFIVAGWVVTAIAAAAISGMIRRDD